MALVYDRQGGAAAGGIVQIRDAFVAASDGKLVCLDATMTYDHSAGPNAQVLRFAGRYAADGKPFKIESNPILPGAPLAAIAGALARRLLE